MASPFRIFRKFRKTLIVIAGVVLMFVFVIGDALMQYYAGSRGGSGGDPAFDVNATAVSWDGGSLTNAELDRLVMQRRILNAFIQNVEFAGRQAALEAGVEPRSLRVEPIIGPDTPQQGIERSVVHTQLFAQAAREAGMHVGDETIVQYLDDLGRGNVSRDDMRAMLNRLQSGSVGVSIDYLIDALREEMLARNYIASHQFAMETVTPQQRWDDWLKVNDRVVIEAAAIPVERFVAEVPEPTESELLAFFDDYKNREPQPDVIGQMEIPSPTPGFRIPRKIDVQFIQANYDKYVDTIEGEVTDEEIEKYYEENKDPLFIKLDTGLIDEPSDTEPPADDAQSNSQDSATDQPIETPNSEAPTDSIDDAVPDTESPAEPAETTETETPAADPADESAAPGDGDQSSRSVPSQNPFRLAAFLQDADSKDATDESSEAPADAAVESADTSTQSPPASADSASADSTPAEPGATADAAAETTAETPPAEEKPKEFQPLEELRDVIRRELAERRAAEKLNELVTELASGLNVEFTTYFGEVLNAQAEERNAPAPPASLADIAPLAKKHGLEHGRTGPLSGLELRETPVGKSGSGETGVELFRLLFGTRDLELYQPVVTVDIDGNRYVAMKTSDTPARTPELADVKDDVIRTWKKEKAAALALKHAQEQAKNAEQASATLGDFFSSDQSVEVVRSDPFSKFTGGDVAMVSGQFQQQPFRLAEPDGIVAAGPEFLDEVFELKENDVVAALNHDHSIAYVVRIVQHMSTPDELHAAYLSEANTWPGLRLMINSHSRVAAATLVNDIATNYGLHWERPSDQVRQDEEEAG